MAERRRHRLRGAALTIVAAAIVAGCSALQGSAPEPTPLDFPGIANQLALAGLTVASPISGDAGCTDGTLIPTAIGFDLSGLGVTSPIRARVYIFRDGPTYDRRRPDVDTCVAAWASDPPTVEFVDASPFVLVVQGPVPAAFKTALRTALRISAGSGG